MTIHAPTCRVTIGLTLPGYAWAPGWGFDPMKWNGLQFVFAEDAISVMSRSTTHVKAMVMQLEACGAGRFLPTQRHV